MTKTVIVRMSMKGRYRVLRNNELIMTEQGKPQEWDFYSSIPAEYRLEAEAK